MCLLLGTPQDKALEQIRRTIPGADPPLDPLNLVRPWNVLMLYTLPERIWFTMSKHEKVYPYITRG